MAGQLKTEGGAVDVVVPAATAITKGEVYRIDGWTGFAMRSVTTTDTERTIALEVAPRIWYFSIPAAVAAARGDVLYWTAGTGFKKASTDLSATVAGAPVVKVEEAKDANNVVAAKVLNIG